MLYISVQSMHEIGSADNQLHLDQPQPLKLP
jgi:hypothetical protein